MKGTICPWGSRPDYTGIVIFSATIQWTDICQTWWNLILSIRSASVRNLLLWQSSLQTWIKYLARRFVCPGSHSGRPLYVIMDMFDVGRFSILGGVWSYKSVLQWCELLCDTTYCCSYLLWGRIVLLWICMVAALTYNDYGHCTFVWIVEVLSEWRADLSMALSRIVYFVFSTSSVCNVCHTDMRTKSSTYFANIDLWTHFYHILLLFYHPSYLSFVFILHISQSISFS